MSALGTQQWRVRLPRYSGTDCLGRWGLASEELTWETRNGGRVKAFQAEGKASAKAWR